MMNQNDQSNEQQWMLLVLLLKKISEEKGISQNEIAKRTGYTQSNVSRMLNMNYCPTIRTFITVAKAIGVNFFIEDKEGKTDLNKMFEAAMTELGRRPNKLNPN